MRFRAKATAMVALSCTVNFTEFLAVGRTFAPATGRARVMAFRAFRFRESKIVRIIKHLTRTYISSKANGEKKNRRNEL